MIGDAPVLPGSAVDEITLRDGSRATLRCLTAADRPMLETLFATTGEDHLYTRFFSLGRDVVVRHLDHLFAGGPMVTAYVVVVADRIIAVSDVERLDDVRAEVAFLVADDMHHLGLATLLLKRADLDARRIGITWFVADVLARNFDMLEVFTDAGFDVELLHEGTDVEVRMSTALPAQPTPPRDVGGHGA